MYPLEVRDEPARRVIGVPHRGAYPAIGAAFDRLAGLMDEASLWAESRGMFGIYLDDPNRVPEQDLRSMAAVEVGEDLALPPGFEEMRLAPGRHAVARLTGPYTGLPAVFDWLYREGLPRAGLVPRDGPELEIYLNDPTEVPESELVTEVCVPVA